MASRIAEAKQTSYMDQVAECAYYKAEQRGFAPGYELDDWLEAERELQAMTNGTSARAAKKKAAARKKKVATVKV